MADLGAVGPGASGGELAHPLEFIGDLLRFRDADHGAASGPVERTRLAEGVGDDADDVFGQGTQQRQELPVFILISCKINIGGVDQQSNGLAALRGFLDRFDDLIPVAERQGISGWVVCRRIQNDDQALLRRKQFGYLRRKIRRIEIPVFVEQRECRDLPADLACDGIIRRPVPVAGQNLISRRGIV